MEGFIKLFCTDKTKVFRRYFRHALLLLIITCALGFLAQNLAVREVYKEDDCRCTANVKWNEVNIKTVTLQDPSGKAKVYDVVLINNKSETSYTNISKTNVEVYIDPVPYLNNNVWNKIVGEKKRVARVARAYTRLEFNHTKHEVFGTLQQGARQSNITRKTIMNGKEILDYIRNNTSFNKTKGVNVNKNSLVDISQPLKNAGKAIANHKVLNPYAEVVSETLSRDIRNTWSESNGKALAVFILSAIGYNFTTAPGYKREIKLNAWQGAKHSRVLVKCCVLWKNQEKSEYFTPNKTTRGKRLNLVATQLTCPIKGPLKDVFGVTLQFADQTCPVNQTDYILPYIPKLLTKRHSFAICLKILYGNIDNKLLVDWIEFYKEIRVDKIFMFVHNITQDTGKIIRFYEDLGFLETRKFAFPWKKGRNVGMKKPVVWEDEQVVVYDCFYRLQGYTYIAIIDLDEFLLPRKHANVKDMMRYLMETYPKAAGFALKTFMFNKSWGVSGRVNGSDVFQYIQRTSALAGVPARSKNILIPSRVQVDRVFYTHEFNPRFGYESYTVNESIVAVNHYRVCYRNLAEACNKSRRVIDTSVLKVIDKIQRRTRWIT